VNVEQALLHALSRHEPIAVRDGRGRLMGHFDPREATTRGQLRAMAADDPSLTFETVETTR